MEPCSRRDGRRVAGGGVALLGGGRDGDCALAPAGPGGEGQYLGVTAAVRHTVANPTMLALAVMLAVVGAEETKPGGLCPGTVYTDKCSTLYSTEDACNAAFTANRQQCFWLTAGCRGVPAEGHTTLHNTICATKQNINNQEEYPNPNPNPPGCNAVLCNSDCTPKTRTELCGGGHSSIWSWEAIAISWLGAMGAFMVAAVVVGVRRRR